MSMRLATTGSTTLVVALIAALLVSAIALVHTKHRARQLFIELQDATRERDELSTEYWRLQIEQNTYGELNRIEVRAQEDLGLRRPAADEVFLINARGGILFTGLAPLTEEIAAELEPQRPEDVTP